MIPTLILCLAFSQAGCSPAKKNTEAPGRISLNVLMPPNGADAWRKLFDEFNRQHPDIVVHFVEGPGETNTLEDLYATAFMSGSRAYDLVLADTCWVPKFVAAGWLLDLTDRWPKGEWDRFVRAAVDAGSYQGRIYRVPVQLTGGLLYYRKDLLARAGLAPPNTLAELQAIARQLQRPGERWGYVWQGRQYEGLACNFVEILTAFGGYWIDPETNAVGLDEAPAVAAVSFMRDCVQRDPISPPGVTTYAEEEARQLFQNGKAVFERNWPYAWPLAQKADSPIRGQVGVIAMPSGPNGYHASTLGGAGFAIAKSSLHPEAAWTFITFISALPQIQALQRETGLGPALEEYYAKSDDPFDADFRRALRHAVARPAVPQYAQASDILQRAVSAVLTKRLQPEEAMRGAARETRLMLQPGGQPARR